MKNKPGNGQQAPNTSLHKFQEWASCLHRGLTMLTQQKVALGHLIHGYNRGSNIYKTNEIILIKFKDRLRIMMKLNVAHNS